MAAEARRGFWPLVLVACLLAAGAESLWLGKDVNWDLKNYHYYNADAFVHGRLAQDVAPAQIQSFHSPIADLPFYAMVQLDANPRVIAFAMAATTGIGVFFLLRLAALLLPAPTPIDRAAYLAAATAIGATGAAGVAVTGSTMNEWPSAALLLAALCIAVRSVVKGETALRDYALAGFLAGCAFGLKLTYGVFAAALVLAVGLDGTARERLRRVLATALGAAAGFLVAYGYWALTLQREFASPFFPYFNALFKSPWWEPVSFYDHDYGPRTLKQALAFPLLFATKSWFVSDQAFQDFRLALLWLLAPLVVAKWLVKRRVPGTDAPWPEDVRRGWRLLAGFTLAAYLLWLKLFGIYRYLVPLEALSGPLIVGCAIYLVPGTGPRRIAIAVLAVALVATTRPADWGRVAFGSRYFNVSAPDLPPRSLVIIGHSHPMAYAIPFFRADARFVTPASNFLDPGQSNLLARRVAGIVRAHDGPIYLLDHREPAPQTQVTLRQLGLERDALACEIVKSDLDADAMHVCRVHRVR